MPSTPDDVTVVAVVVDVGGGAVTAVVAGGCAPPRLSGGAVGGVRAVGSVVSTVGGTADGAGAGSSAGLTGASGRRVVPVAAVLATSSASDPGHASASTPEATTRTALVTTQARRRVTGPETTRPRPRPALLAHQDEEGRTGVSAFCRYRRSQHPPEVQVVIVLDNLAPHLSTNKDPRVGEWEATNSVGLAYVPFHAS